METRTISEEYNQIGRELIETEPELVDILNSRATIIFLGSNKKKMEKGKTVFAECEKISDKYKWGIPADFTITVFEPNVAEFTPRQMRILLFHELLHVGIEYTDAGEKYSTRPHDLEDFKLIIEKFGPRWADKEIQEEEGDE